MNNGTLQKDREDLSDILLSLALRIEIFLEQLN
jgi:hypothetical protein